MYKSMFRPEVIRRVELCFFRPCKTSILASDVKNPARGYLCCTLNFCLYKPCAMCLSWLHFQPCAGREPDCNCCLSNTCTYMQLRSPEDRKSTRALYTLSLHALPILNLVRCVYHGFTFSLVLGESPIAIVVCLIHALICSSGVLKIVRAHVRSTLFPYTLFRS